MNIKKLTDEEIISKICFGETKLYEEVMERFQAKLTRYTTYLVRDYHSANDVVQETFIKAYINLKGFDQKKKFSSWIYRIAHNEAMNYIKKHAREVKFEKIENFDFKNSENLEDSIIKEELREKAHLCLKKIPLIYKEPLSLYFLEDKSYEEISSILRVAIGTVGTRIKRAKILMKKICQKI